MTKPVLALNAYETLVLAEAIKLLDKLAPGVIFVPGANRWGSPFFKYGFGGTQVELNEAGHGLRARVEFSHDFKTAEIDLTDAKLNTTTTKVKVGKGFLPAFLKAFEAEWAGRDAFAEVKKGKTQSWYRTDYNAHTPAQARDCCLYHRAEEAAAYRLALLTPAGTPINFEYRGKAIKGQFQSIKRSVRRAPPGGDPSVNYSAVIDANRLRYTVSHVSIASL